MSTSLGCPISFEYDGLEDRSRVVFPDGGDQTFVYDAARNLSQTTLPQGTVLDFTYDVAGRELTRTSSLGESRSFSYDGRGNLESMTDSTGTTQTHYDASGQFAGMTYPSGASVRYEYDLLGRIDRVLVHPDAVSSPQVTIYGYDAAQVLNERILSTMRSSNRLHNYLDHDRE